MARYRKVDVRIWNDAKFRELTDDAKLVFFFLLTHPHMTAIGAMRSSVPGLAAEIGWKEERLSKAFTEALAKGMARHEEAASLVWLPNFIRYNQPENPNVLKSWATALELLPECDLLTEAIQSVKDFAEGLPKAFSEALPEPFRKGMPKQEQEQEQDNPPVGPQQFGRFWETWPSTERKVAKAKCLKVWQSHKLDALADQIIARVVALKETDTWKRGFEPAPLTYLNQRRWEDDTATPTSQLPSYT